ncbi:hypothetical protein KIN20_037954 [Parelaphostrongylus tenuis]|uniref:Uncharacterized protein n=1 Tax=Parelaphostrongylus tenuis TaxID=148309 RepID=A0AAD5REJ3_PARTN|nr:hypothetical protein KIN20_037954 [Parelaphostrongylus tenuis]
MRSIACNLHEVQDQLRYISDCKRLGLEQQRGALHRFPRTFVRQQQPGIEVDLDFPFIFGQSSPYTKYVPIEKNSFRTSLTGKNAMSRFIPFDFSTAVPPPRLIFPGQKRAQTPRPEANR